MGKNRGIACRGILELKYEDQETGNKLNTDFDHYRPDQHETRRCSCWAQLGYFGLVLMLQNDLLPQASRSKAIINHFCSSLGAVQRMLVALWSTHQLSGSARPEICCKIDGPPSCLSARPECEKEIDVAKKNKKKNSYGFPVSAAARFDQKVCRGPEYCTHEKTSVK